MREAMINILYVVVLYGFFKALHEVSFDMGYRMGVSSGKSKRTMSVILRHPCAEDVEKEGREEAPVEG